MESFNVIPSSAKESHESEKEMLLLKLFPNLTKHPFNAAQVMDLILQLAVQGYLTETWRANHPELVSGAKSVSALLEKINAEKERLIAEKKIKKEKPLPEITDNEKPYNLPEEWEWVRLIEVSEYIQRGKSPKYTEVSEVPVVSQKCVQWSGFNISRVRFITEESLEKYGIERFLQYGDLLWNSTGDGTIGRTCLYLGSDYERIVADSHVTVVRPMKNGLHAGYLSIFSSCPRIQNIVAGRVSGSTKQTELGTGTVKCLEFALPPLEEQKEIVRIVDQLKEEVDTLNRLSKERQEKKHLFVTSALHHLTDSGEVKRWTLLHEHFSDTVDELENVKKLRETILQLAVQGKLTSKWRDSHPELISGDHSVAALLEQIKAEKENLIAEKKIKKEKPLPEITEEEKPYELPDRWEWVRLKSLGKITGGGTPSKSKSTYWGGNYPWISPKDMKSDYLESSQDSVTIEGIKNSSANLIPPGSILVVGRSGILKRKLPVAINLVECTVNQDMKVVMPFLPYLKEFMKLMLIGNEGLILERYIKYGMTVHSLKYAEFELMPLALPSLEEQKEIVRQVDHLMSLCDQLESHITTRNEKAEQLMKAMVAEVLEKGGEG